MSNLETALRSALSKGDVNDPAFRRRVYTAAANAMERSLGEKAGAPERKLVEQRKRLASVISGIEDEVRNPPKTPVEPDPEPETAKKSVVSEARDRLKESQEEGRREPVMDLEADFAEDAETAETEPDIAEPESVAESGQTLHAEPRIDAEEPEAAPSEPKRRKRHPFALGLSVIVLVAFLVAGSWWVIATGAFESAAERDSSVPNPSPTLDAESFAGRDPGTANAPTLAATDEAGLQAEAEGWVTLFEPADPTTLDLSGGATADLRSDPFGDYARLLTPLPDGEARIDIPLGTLLDLEGKAVQISITARSDDGNPTQMSVGCDLGALGDCGRRRFNVDQAASEFLFRIDLPTAQSIDAPGYVILRTDIESGTRPVNLLSSRIREVEK